ncbi:MAG: hypothetical protein RIF33_04830 [Cyclobacteriaceae bacterium]
MKRGLIGLILFLPLVGWSHPVSLTWANVRIKGDQVAINFKVLLEDLIYFHHPEHDGYYQYSTETVKSLSVVHGETIEDYFYLTDAEGQRISLTLKAINTNDLIEEKVEALNLMKYSINYQLTATLPRADWDQLTFHQAFDQHEIGIPSVTFLTAFKDGEKLVTDVEVSPSQPFTLLPSGQQEQINPSELTSSYFSITPLGIRHELTLPYAEYVLLTGQSDEDFDEAATLTYFCAHNPVSADGLKLLPALQHFTSLQSVDEGLLQPESLVYLDLYYPMAYVANKVALTWSDYNWQWRWFDSTILTMDSTYHHTFSRYQPKFFWERKDVAVDLEK